MNIKPTFWKSLVSLIIGFGFLQFLNWIFSSPDMRDIAPPIKIFFYFLVPATFVYVIWSLRQKKKSNHS
ncbi:MAG: hypothetical protein Q8P15_00935 [Nanoarchaeota archaeon]|nr:hypothetical protein [Nanoarchaeota archaeon]